MMKTNRYTRPGAAAIAAAFALSSTSVLAQDAPPAADVPVASDPVPAIIGTTAPAVDPAPTPSEPAIDTSAAVATKAPAKATAVKTAAAPAKATTSARAAPASAAVRTQARDTGVAPELAAAKPIAAPAVAPPVEPTATPLADNGSAQIAFGGALALLALGGAAVGLSRRRKYREVPDERDVPVTVPAPAVSSAPEHARSAFAWGQAGPSPAMAASSGNESPIERAKCGPTPDNPSLSLKKRLKRAAFFERRQREVAAGQAKPIDHLAGLPQRLVDAVRQPRFTAPSYGRVFQPA